MHLKYTDVVKLRKKGESYREIAKALSISKNTVSRWCQNLELPIKAKIIIEEKIKHNKHFFKAYNKHKHEVVELDNKKIKVTKISSERFHITTQVSRASRSKRPIHSLPYGTLDLRVNSRKRFFEVLGLINGLIKQAA